MICYQMKAEGRKQINISADERLSKRLEELARKFGKRSKTIVAQEIVEHYIDFYEEAESSKLNFLMQQRNAALNKTVSKKNEIPVDHSYTEPTRIAFHDADKMSKKEFDQAMQAAKEIEEEFKNQNK